VQVTQWDAQAAPDAETMNNSPTLSIPNNHHARPRSLNRSDEDHRRASVIGHPLDSLEINTSGRGQTERAMHSLDSLSSLSPTGSEKTENKVQSPSGGGGEKGRKRQVSSDDCGNHEMAYWEKRRKNNESAKRSVRVMVRADNAVQVAHNEVKVNSAVIVTDSAVTVRGLPT